jgi:hypothetical protein
VETSAHPDLASLGRRLRDRMDRTLEAEMEAARCAARRNRSLRDLFLAAEDAGSAVRLTATDGETHSGRVAGVGVDHVEIGSDRGLRVVALPHVVSVELSR